MAILGASAKAVSARIGCVVMGLTGKLHVAQLVPRLAAGDLAVFQTDDDVETRPAEVLADGDPVV
jgi:hypothetical protein